MGFSKLTIVIPCYNESKNIGQLIKKVNRANTLGLEKEIIIVDDGSLDDTPKTLTRLPKQTNLKIFFHPQNIGKGSALKTGFTHSTGDIVLIQDADFEYDPNDYHLLLKPILNGQADVVYGSRLLTGFSLHSLANHFLTALSNLFNHLNLTDMETCYKVFPGQLIRQLTPKLESKRFGFEPEITARLAKIKNIRISEVGISYCGRTSSEGKHITYLDGLKSIWEIIKYNLV